MKTKFLEELVYYDLLLMFTVKDDHNNIYLCSVHDDSVPTYVCARIRPSEYDAWKEDKLKLSTVYTDRETYMFTGWPLNDAFGITLYRTKRENGAVYRGAQDDCTVAPPTAKID
jgi:hypothetical protein